jgi:hypothetical protein
MFSKREMKSIYNFLNNTIPTIDCVSSNNYLHNKVRVKHLGEKTEKSFEGKFVCGASSFLLNYYLKVRLDIDTKIMIKKRGYGEYYEDHCFLLYNNKIIIDPTYRQFFVGDISNNDNYMDYLFNENSFLFVGEEQELKLHYDKLNVLYIKENKGHLDIDNLNLWNNAYEHKFKYDLNKIVNCEEYSGKNGNHFIDLRNHLISTIW